MFASVPQRRDHCFKHGTDGLGHCRPIGREVFDALAAAEGKLLPQGRVAEKAFDLGAPGGRIVGCRIERGFVAKVMRVG